MTAESLTLGSYEVDKPDGGLHLIPAVRVKYDDDGVAIYAAIMTDAGIPVSVMVSTEEDDPKFSEEA